MRVLLDTHVVLWLAREPAKVSKQAMTVLSDPTTHRVISAVVAWELSIKTSLGKLPEALPILLGFDDVVRTMAAHELPISRQHAVLAGQLDWTHKDPFDRMLAAQAATEGLTLVTKDRIFDSSPDIRTLW